MVQMLGTAAVYANGSTCGCFSHSLGTCLLFGLRLRPCGDREDCNVVCQTCVFDLNVQGLVGDVIP